MSTPQVPNPLAIITKLVPYVGCYADTLYQTASGDAVELWDRNKGTAYPVVGEVNGIIKVWQNEDSHGPSGRLFEVVLTFPEPPEGEKWHNPEKLTPEVVRIGYRLPVVGEAMRTEWEAYDDDGDEVWFKSKSNSYLIEQNRTTFRVPDTTPVVKGAAGTPCAGIRKDSIASAHTKALKEAFNAGLRAAIEIVERRADGAKGHSSGRADIVRRIEAAIKPS